MIFGYCRISTRKQNIERQVRNITSAYPDVKIFRDIYTGTKTTGRAEFQRMLKLVRSGDTVVFDSVSRMSRNADEGIQLYLQLFDEGVELVFLKEPHINTAVYRNALHNADGLSETGNQIADEYINATRKVLKIIATEQVRLAFEQSQKEVDDLRRRTSEGIETARRNGKQIGQVEGRKLNVKKPVEAKEKILQHAITFGGTLSDSECIKLCCIARNTYYKYKRELIEEGV